MLYSTITLFSALLVLGGTSVASPIRDAATHIAGETRSGHYTDISTEQLTEDDIYGYGDRHLGRIYPGTGLTIPQTEVLKMCHDDFILKPNAYQVRPSKTTSQAEYSWVYMSVGTNANPTPADCVEGFLNAIDRASRAVEGDASSYGIKMNTGVTKDDGSMFYILNTRIPHDDE